MKPTRITTDSTLMEDLRASVQQVQRRGLDAGSTWGDFKRAVERLGIADDTPLASIEYGCSQFPTGRLCVELDDHGYAELREVAYGG